MAYDLTKFQASIPVRSQPFAQALINAAMKIPFPEIDAFILCALVERESGSGEYLIPPGPGGTGDSGHGRGLGQIDDRSHLAWLNSNNWQDPETNLTYCAELLEANLRFFLSKQTVPGLTDGNTVIVSVEQAQRRGKNPGNYQDPRPLLNDQALKAALSGYNTGCGNAIISLALGLDSDFTTTPGVSGKPDYAADILNRAAGFKIRYGN